MIEETKYTEQEWHRKTAVDLFNLTWRLLEKPDRTDQDNDRMIHAAHASRYHWGEVGAPANLARGEWQIAHVYTILNQSQPALYHARRCLTICETNGLADFDMAYAYESVARALACTGNTPESAKYRRLALEAGHGIQDREDRGQFLNDLQASPWY